jgi:hypothetical protein
MPNIKAIFRILIFLVSFTTVARAQDKSPFPAAEDSLKIMAREIAAAKSDSEKALLNESFGNKLFRLLSQINSFAWHFDSLTRIARLESPDNTFRIFNWNLPLSDGTNRYFCLIQCKKDHSDIPVVFTLHDFSESIEKPEEKKLDADHWYGALYYKIIHTKSGSRDIYTLLGWDGLSRNMTQKVIDILTFGKKGEPVLGAQLFRNFNYNKKYRVIFQYSATTSMILRYEEQSVVRKKSYNAKKRDFDIDTEKKPMIVCDRLVPIDPAFEGNPMYYAPAGDVYDGFVFLNGAWSFTKNVDARNVKEKSRHTSR